MERDVHPARYRDLPAGQPFRRAGVVVQDVAHVAGFPARVGDGVPRVAHFKGGQLLDVTVHNGREPAQQPGPVPGRHGTPGRERRRRAVDQAVHLGRRGRLDVRDDLLGRRVDDVHDFRVPCRCAWRSGAPLRSQSLEPAEPNGEDAKGSLADRIRALQARSSRLSSAT